MSPVISHPKTTSFQVIPCKKVAKCTLSFHNVISSRMVEVSQLRKKNFFFSLGRIKQKTKQMLLKGGLHPPQPLPWIRLGAVLSRKPKVPTHV